MDTAPPPVSMVPSTSMLMSLNAGLAPTKPESSVTLPPRVCTLPLSPTNWVLLGPSVTRLRLPPPVSMLAELKTTSA